MQNSQEQFDFCLIDCPPALNVLSINALAAAEEVLIPLQPHFLALQGFGKLLQTVDIVNRRINPRLKVAGVLLCMNDTRASLSNEVRADIDRFLQSARGANNAWSEAEILPTFIRRNIKLAEAPSYGQTIFEYDPTCNGAEDYGKVARFLLGTEEMPAPAPVAAHEPPTDNPMPALGATSETPSDNLVPAPAAASEIPGTDPAPASAAPETPFAGPAPAGAAEPPSDDDTPAPGARPESAGDGPTAAPTAATPEPAADELAPAPPTALPIPIITVNLPVPRCYNPVPIWPESPAGSAPPARPNESPV